MLHLYEYERRENGHYYILRDGEDYIKFEADVKPEVVLDMYEYLRGKDHKDTQFKVSQNVVPGTLVPYDWMAFTVKCMITHENKYRIYRCPPFIGGPANPPQGQKLLPELMKPVGEALFYPLNYMNPDLS